MQPVMPDVAEVTKTLLWTAAFILGVWFLVVVAGLALVAWQDRHMNLRVSRPPVDPDVENWRRDLKNGGTDK